MTELRQESSNEPAMPATTAADVSGVCWRAPAPSWPPACRRRGGQRLL